MNFDLIWPYLEDDCEDHQSKNTREKYVKGEPKRQILKDHSQIRENHQIMLEELRRIYDRDLERRTSSDAKAGIYLATITALLSILAATLPVLLKFEKFDFISVTSSLCISMSVICLLRAALWSAKILKVSSFYVLGWNDAVNAGRKHDAAIVLSELLCKCIDKNYKLNNEKVTCLNMVYALFKSFVFWVFLFLTAQILAKFFPLLESIFSDVVYFLSSSIAFFNLVIDLLSIVLMFIIFILR